MNILLRMSEMWVVWKFGDENVSVFGWNESFFSLMMNELASTNGKQTTKMNENYDAFLFFALWKQLWLRTAMNRERKGK